MRSKSKSSEHPFLIIICLTISFLTLSFQHSFADDGSGTAAVNPNVIFTNTLGHDLNIKYTATETLADGTIALTVPSELPAPNFNVGAAGEVTVDVMGGTLGSIFDDLDSPAIAVSLGDDGWNIEAVLKPLIGLNLNLAADLQAELNAADIFAGSGSLRADIPLSISALSLLEVSIFSNLVAGVDITDFSQSDFLSLRLKVDSLLAADIDLGASALVLSESADLANINPALHFALDAGIVADVDLLADGEWVQVIIDLSGVDASLRDNILSLGLVLETGQLLDIDVGTHVWIDEIRLGSNSLQPVLNGSTILLDLIHLDVGGMITISLGNIDAPSSAGVLDFGLAVSATAAGTLIEIGADVDVAVIDGGSGSGSGGSDGGGSGSGNTTSRDIDGDGNDESAVRVNVDEPCFDFYSDEDQSSSLLFTIDGDGDGCDDFIIDIDGDGKGDVYWDPDDDIQSELTDEVIDADGDGEKDDNVIGFDSDGDGDIDSFIDLEGEERPVVGGEGAGGSNPFDISGGACTLIPELTSPPPIDMTWIGIFALLASLRFLRYISAE